MTAALEGGEWSAVRPGRTLPPGKTRYPFYRRLGGPQDRYGRKENLVHTGIRSRTVQASSSVCYIDWGTRPTVYRSSSSQVITTYPRNSCPKITDISKREILFSLHRRDQNSTHFADRHMSKIACVPPSTNTYKTLDICVSVRLLYDFF
jgi:hypothetical protein